MPGHGLLSSTPAFRTESAKQQVRGGRGLGGSRSLPWAGGWRLLWALVPCLAAQGRSAWHCLRSGGICGEDATQPSVVEETVP